MSYQQLDLPVTQCVLLDILKKTILQYDFFKTKYRNYKEITNFVFDVAASALPINTSDANVPSLSRRKQKNGPLHAHCICISVSRSLSFLVIGKALGMFEHDQKSNVRNFKYFIIIALNLNKTCNDLGKLAWFGLLYLLVYIRLNKKRKLNSFMHLDHHPHFSTFSHYLWLVYDVLVFSFNRPINSHIYIFTIFLLKSFFTQSVHLFFGLPLFTFIKALF